MSQTHITWVSSCPKTYNNMGLGRPKNVTTQRSVPNEKNQNSSDAQKRCCKAAVEKELKKARVNIQAGGTRNTATNCFNQRTGTTHSVLTRSSRAPAPVFNLLRRRFFTADPKGFTDYKCTVSHIMVMSSASPDRLAVFHRAVKRKSFESAKIADNPDLMRGPCRHLFAYRLGSPLPL